MTCPNCSAALSDTAKFCEQCGARAATATSDDDRISIELQNAGKVALGQNPFPLFHEDGNDVRYRAVLAKARELLCAPKDAEIARLKAELAEYKEAWPKAVNIATIRANARREALEEVRELAKVYLVGRPPEVGVFLSRLSALNPNVDTSQPAAETQTPPSVTTCGAYCAEFGATCLLPRCHKGMHAADGLWWPNGAAKEMCEHGRCGKSGWMVRDGRAVVCACVVPRPVAPMLDPPVSLPIITGPLTDVPGDPYALTGPREPASPQWSRASQERDGRGNLTKLAMALDTIEGNGCDCGTDEQGTCMACRCEAALHEQFDAIARLRDLLNREDDPTVAEFDRQPPASDVEGLARVLEPLVLRAIYSNCSYSPSEVARLHAQSIARAAIAFLDGGPRT